MTNSLYLEVAEDFAIVAKGALEAVQVKETGRRVTINSEDIIATIDSFVELQGKESEPKGHSTPSYNVRPLEKKKNVSIALVMQLLCMLGES